MKLSAKITALVFLISLLYAGTSILLNNYLLQKYLQDSQAEWSNTLAYVVAEGIAQNTIDGDNLKAREQLKSIIQLDEAFKYAYITNFEGELFTHTFDKGFPRFLFEHIQKHPRNKQHQLRFKTNDGEIEEIQLPLIKGMRASIHLGINQEEIIAVIAQTRKDTIIISLLITLIGTILAISIAHRISKPLADLSTSMSSYGKGDINTDLPRRSTNPEVTGLIDSFNAMIEGRHKLESELSESEAFISMLLETLPVGLALTRMDGSIVEANAAYSKMLGYSLEELKQMSYWDITPRDYNEEEEEQFASLARTKTYGPYEKEYIHADGHRFPVRLQGHIVHRNDEDFIWSIIEDISEQRYAERNIQRFKSTLDETLDCVFMFTADTLEFFYFNQGAINQVGYDHEALLHMRPFDLKPEYDEQAFRKVISPLLAGTKKSIKFETLHQHKNGHLIPVEIFLQFIDLPHERPHFVALVRDITERKLVERTLQRSNEELEKMVQQRTDEYLHAKLEAERSNKAKSEFLSSMSHELRTPMNAILGFSQIIAMDTKRDTVEAHINEIYNAGRHLMDLINQILELSKIESGTLDVSIENIQIGDLFNECLTLLKPLSEKSNITLINNGKHCDEVSVAADHTRLKQVLINLLSNAIKYNRENGSVIVSCTILPTKRLRIEIEDTGTGLTPDQQKKLFQPFERLGRETGTIEGTGIGLVITKHLVAKMGGDIGIKNSSNDGSTFFVELNISQTDAGQYNQSLSSINELDQPLLYSNANSITKKVLYVEDNPANLKVVEAVIAKSHHYQFLSAQTAEQGLQIAKEDQPDLILMDINLPDIDGFEAYRQLKRMRETCDIPVIAVSANAMENDIRKGLEVGFEQYLTKPFDIKELLSVLDRYTHIEH